MGLGRGPLGVTQRGPSCVISRARDWVVSRARALVGHVGYVCASGVRAWGAASAGGGWVGHVARDVWHGQRWWLVDDGGCQW